MRTRNKGYADYGMAEDDDVQKIFEYCRSPDFREACLLKKIALDANPYIADLLCESIISGKSYEKLMTEKYIPISKSDFYGYRRKCIAKLWEIKNRE